MKNTVKILKTNWINLLGIFGATYIYSVIFSFQNSSLNIFQAMFSALILIGLYGLMFWIGFLILIILLDILLVVKSTSRLRIMLIVEWLIISSPFIYWAAKYNQWLFLVAIVIFFITQLIREQKIKNIKSNTTQ